LVKFYSESDAKTKQNFLENVLGELIHSKIEQNKTQTVGLVTGRDNMKTYMFSSYKK